MFVAVKYLRLLRVWRHFGFDRASILLAATLCLDHCCCHSSKRRTVSSRQSTKPIHTHDANYATQLDERRYVMLRATAIILHRTTRTKANGTCNAYIVPYVHSVLSRPLSTRLGGHCSPLIERKAKQLPSNAHTARDIDRISKMLCRRYAINRRSNRKSPKQFPFEIKLHDKTQTMRSLVRRLT